MINSFFHFFFTLDILEFQLRIIIVNESISNSINDRSAHTIQTATTTKKNINHSLIDYVIIIYSWIERWVIYRPEILYSIILYALLFTCLYVYGWYYRKLARRKKNSFVLHNNIILIKKKFLSVFLLIKKSICIYFTLCTWCTTDLNESESALVGIKQYTVCNWCNFSESK